MGEQLQKVRGRGPSLSPETLARRVTFGIRIAAIRTLAGLSQAQLSTTLGVKRALLARWEQGRLPVCSESILDLAAALGVTVPFLMDVIPTTARVLAVVESEVKAA
ncbi:hypothetical protein LCGC14_2304460 [marine sediment metagenome]|uniref:HTH cro/C1-type domain-containing protein n=1 Tax=marine sediment metagenome TaxID=412755 RepID=A0A0F9FHF2_9ZZZZ